MMDPEVLDKIVFCGKVNDDLHAKIEVYEKELKESEDPKYRKATMNILKCLKMCARIYKGEQKLLTFEN